METPTIPCEAESQRMQRTVKRLQTAIAISLMSLAEHEDRAAKASNSRPRNRQDQDEIPRLERASYSLRNPTEHRRTLQVVDAAQLVE